MSPEAKSFGQQPAYPPTMIDGLRYEGMTKHEAFAKAFYAARICINTGQQFIAEMALKDADALCEALARCCDPHNCPRRIERAVWANIYASDRPSDVLHPSRESADRHANSSRLACVKLRISFVEGEGLHAK